MSVNINPILQKIGTAFDEYIKKHAKETTTGCETSLTYRPSHDLCEEFVKDAEEFGITNIAAFPKLTERNCERFDEARAVIDRGLSFSLALCPTCPHVNYCEYHCKLQEAFRAQHAVAPSERGVYALEEMTRDRTHITVDEDPLRMLRPTFTTRNGLILVSHIAENAQVVAADRPDAIFYRRMKKIARWLHHNLRRATENKELKLPPPPRHVPHNLHDVLNTHIIKRGVEHELTPPPATLRLVLAAALGKLTWLQVCVDSVAKGRNTDGTVRVKRNKKLVGVASMKLSPDVVLWINDATTTKEELEAALGRTVGSVTPPGQMLLKHKVIQVIPYKDGEEDEDGKKRSNDIAKRTSPKRALPILRGVLHDLPHQKVGLITHQHLARTLPAMLGSPYQERLAMVSWFGGSLSRGSNKWHETCEALVILGTPRVSPTDIRMHLIVLGKIAAAKIETVDAGWEMDWWLGFTESGQGRVVKTLHYRNHDWHAAYLSKTRSELVQAIGRGRGYLPEGKPVYVVTTEKLSPPDEEDGWNGPRLAEEGKFTPLTDDQCEVLACLASLKTATTTAIGLKLGKPKEWVNKRLVDLEAAGRVMKLGSAGVGRGRPSNFWQVA